MYKLKFEKEQPIKKEVTKKER